MVNIKTLDSNISCILQKLFDGEKIFRINLENMTVADLGDKSINVIRRDEHKHPDKYVYFMVGKEEKYDERCPGDFTLESAYYDGVYRK